MWIDPALGASDGKTYLRMYASEPARHESVSQQLCAALVLGQRYHITLNLASRRYAPTDVPAFLEIWGANGSCGEEQLLWASTPGTPDWQTHCAVLAPTANFTHLTLKPRAASGEGGVFVDGIRSVASCQ